MTRFMCFRKHVFAFTLMGFFAARGIGAEYHVCVSGNDANSGSVASPFKTISKAADQARPGDVITVHAGLYRERINPPRGGTSDDKRIVYQAAPGGKVVIKGSEQITTWKQVDETTWTVTLPNSYFDGYNPYGELVRGDWYEAGRPYHTGAVYLNGHWLKEAARKSLVVKTSAQEASGDSNAAYWFAEVGTESTTIWAQFKGADPNKELVEINVRQSVFYPEQPGMNYITVRGFTLEQAATPWAPPTAEQIGVIGTHWSKGWLIEDNTIRYSTCAGLTLGKGRDPYDNKQDYHSTIRVSLGKGWNRETIGSHVVRNNHIHDCGQAGICGSLGCSFSSIIGNEVHDIRKHHEYFGCEAAGIKLHGFVDGIIKDNHIYRCEHWGGLWLDWMAQGARVTGNLMHDNSQDMMFEVNHGPFLVDHNLMLSRKEVTKVSSSGAYAHNLWFDNIKLWPTEIRQTPYFKTHGTEIVKDAAPINQSDDRYHNNIFVGAMGTSALDEHGFHLTGSGNIFLGGAVPSKHEKNAIAPKDFDPQIQLTEEPDGWWLKMETDPAWGSLARNLVTTDLLGRAAVTGAAYEQRDGSPYLLDTDYFGNKRLESNLSAGPFRFSSERTIRVRVWPKPVKPLQ